MKTGLTKIAARAVGGAGGGTLFASANFMLSIALQQSSPAAVFGLYAFTQVVIITIGNFSGALFGGPALVALARGDVPEDTVLGSFFRANAVFCLAGGAALAVISLFAGASETEAILLATLGAILLLRIFLRASVLALRKRREAAFSDLTYALVVLVGLAVSFATVGISIVAIIAVQTLSSIISMLPISDVLGRSVRGSLRPVGGIYRNSFVRHGRWALAATAANAVTANGYAYLLALGAGTAIFGPVALATLLFRPLGVILTGLIQFERPAMARKVVSRTPDALNSDVRFVMGMVGATWVANLAAVAALIGLYPNLLLREGYPADLFFTALVLVAIVVLTRAMRDPQTAALQAAGEYKDLARVAFISAPVSLIAVLALWFAFPSQPSLVLLGALCGELTSLALVSRRYRTLLSSLRPAPADVAPGRGGGD